MKPKKVSPLMVILGAIILVTVLAAIKLGKPEPHSYSFVTVDHPVDMWQDGIDKWAYYSIGEGVAADLATKARTELTPQGFTEDRSKAPWYRFVKDDLEVVVCNHDEFGVDHTKGGAKLMKPPPLPGAVRDRPWPCVLVKNGLGTQTSLNLFQVKKLIRGW